MVPRAIEAAEQLAVAGEHCNRRYAALQRWCAASGRQQTGTSWEVYGDWADDPKQRRTDIYLLLARVADGLSPGVLTS